MLALALLGLLGDVWPRRLRIGLAIALAAAAILSMGTEFLDGRVGFRLLFDHAPGWDGYRTPGRIHTVTTLCLALFAAAGAQWFTSAPALRRRPWAAPVICVGLALVMLVEGGAFRAHPSVPPPPRGLAEAVPPLMHLPANSLATSADDGRTYSYMVWSTDGFPALVNGLSGFIPRVTNDLSLASEGFPDRRSVASLRDAGIRTVIVHPGWTRGTPWAGAASRPVAGLGIERRRVGGVVLFDLSGGD